MAKRKKDTTDTAEADKAFGKVMTNENIKKVMSENLATCKCVLLKADGSMSEMEVDMTPRLRKVQHVLNGEVTFIGQWERIEVILVVNKMLQHGAGRAKDINKHKLQPPFHKADDIYGDILLTKSDKNGNPKDFTLKEYKAFQKLKIKEWEPKDEESEEELDEEDDDGEDDDEEDDAEEDDDDDDEEEFMEALQQKLIDSYKEKHGKEPSKKEVENLMKQLVMNMGGQVEEEEEEEEEEKPKKSKKGRTKK